MSMKDQPVRLGKVETSQPLMDDFENWILLHPAAIFIGVGISLFLALALIFAITGNAAVESGGMRNFIANGC